MKILSSFFLATSLFLVTSCDDGDIIVNEFQFEAKDLTFCNTDPLGSKKESVLYNVNSTNEAMAINLSEIFDPNLERDNKPYPINANTRVFYRKFTSPISGGDYFCSPVPSTSANIQTELIADRGTIFINTIKRNTNTDDSDNDGIPNIREGVNNDPQDDSDNDGIPDYLDQDDDNDNVLTKDEILVEGDLISFLNTDDDGISDHKDDDDDDDGTLTRNEVSEKFLDPRGNANKTGEFFNYLAPDIKSKFVSPRYLKNDTQVQYVTTITIENFGLSDGETTTIREKFDMGNIINDSVESKISPLDKEVKPVDNKDPDPTTVPNPTTNP